MNTTARHNAFPAGAEQGSQAWSSFWENEAWPVVPGTRIAPEKDFSPTEHITTRQHVIGAVSVAEWFNEASQALEDGTTPY